LLTPFMPPYGLASFGLLSYFWVLLEVH